MFIFSAFANFHLALPLAGSIGVATQDNTLKLYAWAFLCIGLWQRRRRWKEMLGGVRWHGYSMGVSYLEFLPIRTDRVYRVVEPFATFLIALTLRKLGLHALGAWLLLCSASLAIVAGYSYEAALNRDLDTMDSMIESELQAETVDHFDKPGDERAKARTLHETAGVPTGTDDLQEVIARRRKEAAARAEVRS